MFGIPDNEYNTLAPKQKACYRDAMSLMIDAERSPDNVVRISLLREVAWHLRRAGDIPRAELVERAIASERMKDFYYRCKSIV